jgi:dipeptidyl aminopeptidase/acylaminoacyl peptidase
MPTTDILAYIFSGGTPEEKKMLHAERAPRSHVDRLKMLVLILAGENDSISQLKPIQKFCEEAKKHNVPVRLIIREGEGHGSISNENAIQDAMNMLEHLKRVYETSNVIL